MKCPYCGKKAQWVPNEAIYGKRYGRSFMAYYCKPCEAYVGCHNNTRKPLGTMANKELRQYRMRAHLAFDPVWKSGRMTRDEAYKLISEQFGYRVHIGSCGIDECKKIIELYS